MKAPSKDIAKSLLGQKSAGRSPVEVQTSDMSGRPSMTVPGDGDIEMAPGREHDRSASKFVDPMKRFGG